MAGTSGKKSNRKTKSEIQEENNISRAMWIALGIIVAIFFELSNFGILGTVGGWLKNVQFGLFGALAYLFPVLLFMGFLMCAFAKGQKTLAPFFAVLCLISLCSLAHIISGVAVTGVEITNFYVIGADQGTGGGFLGGLLDLALTTVIGQAGAVIFSIILALFCVFMIFRKQIVELVQDMKEAKTAEKEELKKEKEIERQAELKARAAAAKSRGARVTENYNQGTYTQEELDIEKLAKQGKTGKLRTREKTVFETVDDEGRTVRIVHTTRKAHKVKRAVISRSKNKATPMRDGEMELDRLNKKGEGVASNVSIVSTSAGGDEIHEITNAKPKVVEVKEEVQEKKTSKITIKDVPSKPKTKVRGVASGDTLTVGDGKTFDSSKTSEIVETKKNITIENGKVTENIQTTQKTQKSPGSDSIFAKASDSTTAARPSSGARSLSSGEPQRTFTPEHTTRGDSFKLPDINILAKRKQGSTGMEDVYQIAAKLEQVLETFGVHAKVVDTQVGPSVTRFELEPEMGTKVSKVTSLADDLKLNLAVKEIRIEAPIPGKAAIGIEIPNKSRQTVLLRELLSDSELINNKSKIAFSAGKDISGNVVVTDLAKMPHLLVAGTTGSGKSVFLNSIIMCILYRATPAEVGFIIVDPKRVEFSNYAGIPHLMKEIVTDPGQAVSTLRWAVAEMSNRYQRMQMSGVRDFTSYNEKYDRGQVSKEEENPRRMPQIVIVIDELADLMMVAAKEVESLICRLAQLARAAGIHLVIATQRPSVDVVTGLIKANIPARAALLVASGVDSRTIIDMVGAEKLLGNGDMLFYPTGYVKPVRVQGAYVSDKEIIDTVKYLVNTNTQNFYEAENQEMEKFMNAENESLEESGNGKDKGSSKYDELFYDAAIFCIEQEKASSSFLQRRFSIGFNRAAKIVDQMYDFGLVGPANGSKPREVVMDSITFEERYAQMLQDEN